MFFGLFLRHPPQLCGVTGIRVNGEKAKDEHEPQQNGEAGNNHKQIIPNVHIAIVPGTRAWGFPGLVGQGRRRVPIDAVQRNTVP